MFIDGYSGICIDNAVLDARQLILSHDRKFGKWSCPAPYGKKSRYATVKTVIVYTPKHIIHMLLLPTGEFLMFVLTLITNNKYNDFYR